MSRDVYTYRLEWFFKSCVPVRVRGKCLGVERWSKSGTWGQLSSLNYQNWTSFPQSFELKLHEAFVTPVCSGLEGHLSDFGMLLCPSFPNCTKFVWFLPCWRRKFWQSEFSEAHSMSINVDLSRYAVMSSSWFYTDFNTHEHDRWISLHCDTRFSSASGKDKKKNNNQRKWLAFRQLDVFAVSFLICSTGLRSIAFCTLDINCSVFIQGVHRNWYDGAHCEVRLGLVKGVNGRKETGGCWASVERKQQHVLAFLAANFLFLQGGCLPQFDSLLLKLAQYFKKYWSLKEWKSRSNLPSDLEKAFLASSREFSIYMCRIKT